MRLKDPFERHLIVCKSLRLYGQSGVYTLASKIINTTHQEMLKKIFLFLSMLPFCVDNSIAQSLIWNEVEWYSQQSDLYCIAFNGQKGITAGENGSLMISLDEGKSWTPDRIENAANIFGICFLDSMTILASGEHGIIYRSLDAGRNWETTNLLRNENIYSVVSLSGSIAIAVGENGLIARTIDKGISWERIELNSDDTLQQIISIDSLSAIAIGSKGIIKTTDGGDNWSRIESGVTSSLRSLIKPTENILYAAGDKWTMLKSTDKGETWKTLIIDSLYFPQNAQIHCLGYFDQNRIYACVREERSGFYSTYSTTDGGDSWLDEKKSHKDARSSVRISIKESIMVGDNSTIENTYNSGKTWQSFKFSPTIDRIIFSDSIGLLFGHTFSNFIYRTTNEGLTWRLVLNENLMPQFRDVSFPQKNMAIAVLFDPFSPLDSNIIVRSWDGGKTWEKIQHTITGPILNIAMLDESRGILYRTNPNEFMLTTNGGIDWRHIENPNIQSTCFSDQLLFSGNSFIALVYNNGKKQVHTSPNLGQSWSVADVALYTDRLFFLDSLTGWLIGSERTGVGDRAKDIMYKTMDGGINWIEIINSEIEPAFGISDIAFGDKNLGIASRRNYENLYFTNNGGKTWNLDEGLDGFIVAGTPRGLTFSDSKTCFINCINVILQSKFTPFVSVEQHFERPIMQFYPNPSDKEIKAHFFPTLHILNIEIYDLLGRRYVCNWVKEKDNDAKIDVSKLLDGVYLIVVTEQFERISSPVIVRHSK